MRLFLLACLYVLTSFGFAFVAGYAKISLPFRKWLIALVDVKDALGFYSRRDPPFIAARRWVLDLLQCPACLGFWIGGAFALVDAHLFGASAVLGLDHLPVAALILIFGLATSASNFILGVVTRLVEVN